MIVRHALLTAMIGVTVGLGGNALSAPSADSSSATAGDASVTPQFGTWRSHKLDFQFMGFTATYSCDSLSEKLTLLLRKVGARTGFNITPVCGRDYAVPDKSADAQVAFESLQPFSPSGSEAAGPTVPGVWRHVELQPRAPIQLTGTDCELVEQFRNRLLPMFTIRNLQSRVNCVPYQSIGDQYFLSFDVFTSAAGKKL